MQTQRARTYIRDYRQMAQRRSQKLLDAAMARIDQGEDAKVVLAEFAHGMSQTLMHSPSRLIRQAAKVYDADTLDAISQELIHSHRKPI